MKIASKIGIVLCICISLVFVTSCDATKDDIEAQIKKEAYNIYENIKKSIEENTAKDDVLTKIANVMKQNNLDAKVENDNIIVELEATDDYEKKDTKTIQMDYNMSNIDASNKTLAGVITTCKEATAHPKMNIVISYADNTGSIGASKLQAKYLDADQVINLNSFETDRVLTSSAGLKEYVMTRELELQNPTGTVAYEVNISDLPNINSGDRKNVYTNPIMFMGELLSSMKGGGMNIELASFETDDQMMKYPTFVKCIIVVDGGMREKIENKLLSAEENFADKTEDLATSPRFEYKEVELPNVVYTKETSSNLVSLLYTLEAGNIQKDEEKEDVLGVLTVYNVNIGKNITVKALARYKDNNVSTNIDGIVAGTCELSDFTLTSNEILNVWQQDEENKILENEKVKTLIKKLKYDDKNQFSFISNPISVIQGNIKTKNIVSLPTNERDLKDITIALIDFIS